MNCSLFIRSQRSVSSIVEYLNCQVSSRMFIDLRVSSRHRVSMNTQRSSFFKNCLFMFGKHLVLYYRFPLIRFVLCFSGCNPVITRYPKKLKHFSYFLPLKHSLFYSRFMTKILKQLAVKYYSM